MLNGLARQTIDLELIKENWDDLLRVARRVVETGDGQCDGVGADPARGRASLHLNQGDWGTGPHCQDPLLTGLSLGSGHRRRILIQLNKGESRHSLARATFHGHKGEIRQRY